MKFLAAWLSAVLVAACSGDDRAFPRNDRSAAAQRTKSSAGARAARRAFDGAPPVIPHDDFGVECASCHNDQGLAVESVGFAPPSPHGETPGLSAESRCRQCHVFQRTDELFAESGFVGLQQDMRDGPRAYEGAPPVIPHPSFLRANCQACHAGPAAREEVRTSHPERTNCNQCHAQQESRSSFQRV